MKRCQHNTIEILLIYAYVVNKSKRKSLLSLQLKYVGIYFRLVKTFKYHFGQDAGKIIRKSKNIIHSLLFRYFGVKRLFLGFLNQMVGTNSNPNGNNNIVI